MNPRRTSPIRRFLGASERLLAAVGLLALVHYTCVDFTVMVSGSMAPALRGDDDTTGDRVLIEKITRRLRSPRRWEIHQFHTEEGLLVAKRIVGLPGERVSLRDGALCINGAPAPLPPDLARLRYLPFGNLAGGREIECGAGYYVLGDDSRDSFDSRFTGVIAGARFLGRAWLVLEPAEHRGFVR